MDEFSTVLSAGKGVPATNKEKMGITGKSKKSE
jgi:hypothetical protein